jgi:transcriptional regulator with XRE-family HTH domain
MLNIGERLQALREQNGLSQREVEKKTGLLRTYVSRLETGSSTPSLRTLMKFSRVFKVPMYQLLYDGEEPPKLATFSKRKSDGEDRWGEFGKEARMLKTFCQLFSRMTKRDLGLLLRMARDMSKPSQR